MDTLSHIVWGQMVFGKPHMFAAVAVVSNLPDLVGWVPWGIRNTVFQLGFAKQAKINNNKRYRLIELMPLPTKIYHHLYLFTHSLVAWGIFTWILQIFWPGYRVLSLAYLMHILMDIPFHTGRWSMRPFFPFSDFAVKGQYFWQRGIIILNLFSLGILKLVLK